MSAEIEYEAPEGLLVIPVFMLKIGDMVWHPFRRWFYECYAYGHTPSAIFNDHRLDSGPDDDVLIAPDRMTAIEWNDARRAETLS